MRLDTTNGHNATIVGRMNSLIAKFGSSEQILEILLTDWADDEQLNCMANTLEERLPEPPKERLKLYLKTERFIDWYFSDKEEDATIIADVKSYLSENVPYTLTTEELLDKCGYIPYYICEISGLGVDASEDVDEEKYQIVLI